MTVLAQTWQTRPQVGRQPESGRSVREPQSLASRPPATGSLLLDPLPPGARPPRTRKLPVSRRTATIGVSALALAAVAVLVVTLVTGSSPRSARLRRARAARMDPRRLSHLLRAATARRLPDDRPHRRLG